MEILFGRIMLICESLGFIASLLKAVGVINAPWEYVLAPFFAPLVMLSIFLVGLILFDFSEKIYQSTHKFGKYEYKEVEVKNEKNG